MPPERTASAVAPALVACMCAVAMVLTLGSYLYLHGDLAELRKRLDAGTARAERAENERRELARAMVALERAVEEVRLAHGAPVPGNKGWALDPANAGGTGPTGSDPAVAGGPDSGGAVPEMGAVPPLMREEGVDGNDGRVLVVSPQQGGLAMVDRGRRDGLRESDTLFILRDGQILGRARVTQMFDHMAVCRLPKDLEVRTGDRARGDAAD